MITQSLKDSEKFKANNNVRNYGTKLKYAGRAQGAAAIVIDGIMIHKAYKADKAAGDSSYYNTKVQVSKTSGALVGAAAGATIGSVVPVVGTVIGGIVGGIIGSWVGGKAATSIIAKPQEKPVSKQIVKSNTLSLSSSKPLGTPKSANKSIWKKATGLFGFG